MTGQDIRDFRGKHNMTQKQLADRLGVTQQLVSAYEREKKEIPGIFISALCMYAETKRLAAENAKLDIRNTELEAASQAIAIFESNCPNLFQFIWERPVLMPVVGFLIVVILFFSWTIISK